MGMGHMAASVVRINEKVIKRKCPKLLAEFRKLFEKYDPYVVSGVIEGQAPIDDDEQVEEILTAHAKLIEAFEAKTGLKIEYFYHDSDNEGDRYDDIGEAWCVSNAYELTPVAKPYAKNISTARFVIFG